MPRPAPGPKTAEAQKAAAGGGRRRQPRARTARHSDDAKFKRAYEGGRAGKSREELGLGDDTDERVVDTYKAGRREHRAKNRRTTVRKVRRTLKKAPTRKITKAAKQLTPTAAAQVSSAGGALALSLVVVALYLVLNNTAPLTGFVGGAGKALEWLIRPDRSIPYGPGK